MGHILMFNNPGSIDYFIGELGAHCVGQPSGTIGYRCFSQTQETSLQVYNPGPDARQGSDPYALMSSTYAERGSYEDFAETWREVV